jgi:hypothetical protein
MQVAAAEEEKAKAMETEADAAAEQPKEEAQAGEPAADGAVAAPMETDAKEPEPAAEPEAPAAEVCHLHSLTLALAEPHVPIMQQKALSPRPCSRRQGS